MIRNILSILVALLVLCGLLPVQSVRAAESDFNFYSYMTDVNFDYDKSILYPFFNHLDFDSDFELFSFCQTKASEFNTSYFFVDLASVQPVVKDNFTYYFFDKFFVDSLPNYSILISSGSSDPSHYLVSSSKVLCLRFDNSLNYSDFGYCRFHYMGVGDFDSVFHGDVTDDSIYNWHGDNDVAKSVILSDDKKNDLIFTVSGDFSEGMNFEELNSNFTIAADNTTNNYYNYIVYVSESPATSGIVNSLNTAKYFMSSTQWCYVFQQDYQVDNNLLDQIKNNVSDDFTTTDVLDYMLHGTSTLYNVFGGAFNGLKQYISLKNSSMSFYSLVQTNCPVYLVKGNDIKTHIIPFSSLNVDLNKDYYLNILYYQPDMSVVGAIGSSTAALLSAGNNEMMYPIFNTDFFKDYTVYSSTLFSVTNGVFTKNDNDMTGYNDVIKSSNPDNASATISSDDDIVNINRTESYDSSVKTNYYNYGTIYHGCTINYGGSGGGNSAVDSFPDLPEFDFEDLTDKTGGFLAWCKSIVEAVGFIPITLFTALVVVCVYCRILGR